MSARSNEGGHAYETTDAKTMPLWGSAALLAAIIIGSFLIGSRMLESFQGARDEQIEENPLVNYQARPDEAVLQARPKQGMEAYRAEIEAIATSYGWVDEPNEVVRIPVERAMDLLLERGLPTRENPTRIER